jgi:hypothetical protein
MASIARSLTNDFLRFLFPQAYGDRWMPPSRLELILNTPMQYLITLGYRLFNWLHVPRPSGEQYPITVVAISDTHTLRCHVPDGDLLIHAGDLSNTGTPLELQHQIDWLHRLPHRHKVAIAGNHDTWLDPLSRRTLGADADGRLDWKSINYLEHDRIRASFPVPSADRDPDAGRTSYFDKHPPVRKLVLYGAPQTPRCGGPEHAFQYGPLMDGWTGTVPDATEILVTHAPPQHHLDLGLGCSFLLRELWRVKPKLHVFGHVHGGAGREVLRWDNVQRVYERAMGRAVPRGMLWQLSSAGLWYDVAALVWYGAWGMVWERLWGGVYQETILVNASAMKQGTNMLSNAVQVVVL